MTVIVGVVLIGLFAATCALSSCFSVATSAPLVVAGTVLFAQAFAWLYVFSPRIGASDVVVLVLIESLVVAFLLWTAFAVVAPSPPAKQVDTRGTTRRKELALALASFVVFRTLAALDQFGLYPADEPVASATLRVVAGLVGLVFLAVFAENAAAVARDVNTRPRNALLVAALFAALFAGFGALAVLFPTASPFATFNEFAFLFYAALACFGSLLAVRPSLAAFGGVAFVSLVVGFVVFLVFVPVQRNASLVALVVVALVALGLQSFLVDFQNAFQRRAGEQLAEKRSAE